MIIFVSVKLKKLFKKERNYSWPRPKSCPRCSDYKVWGHGYAQVIFDGYEEPLLPDQHPLMPNMYAWLPQKSFK